MNQNRKKKEGRKKKTDPSIYRYTVNLNEKENLRFQRMMSEAGEKSYSRFFSNLLFERELKVVRLDKGTFDYYRKLTEFSEQFRAIGVNYNQTVKVIHRNFGEKRAVFLLNKLRESTTELVKLMQEIIKLTQELENKWWQKS